MHSKSLCSPAGNTTWLLCRGKVTQLSPKVHNIYPQNTADAVCSQQASNQPTNLFLTVGPFVLWPHNNVQQQGRIWYSAGVCFFSRRSRQLELEDKHSALELELRKYMEIKGAYWCEHTSIFWCLNGPNQKLRWKNVSVISMWPCSVWLVLLQLEHMLIWATVKCLNKIKSLFYEQNDSFLRLFLCSYKRKDLNPFDLAFKLHF